jgi:hypothetical protein
MTLSEEILTIVHAFSDEGRKNAVRDLARRVQALESSIDDARSDLVDAVRAEREACAKIANDVYRNIHPPQGRMIAEEIAERIRARGQR